MKQGDLWKLSLLNVFASPVRSALTVLGMAIGIGAILAVLTLGNAGQTQVRTEMARLGIDKVWLTAPSGETLRQGDAQLVADALHMGATEQIYLTAEVSAGACKENAMVVGCSQAYLEMAQTRAVEGRMLYPAEWLSGSRAALAGEELARRMRLSPGSMVRVGDMTFRICGVIRTGGGFSRMDAEQAIVLPVEVLGERMGETVHEIMLDVPSGMMPQTAAAMAQRVLESRRGLEAQALTMQVQIEAANSVIHIFVEVLKWIAFICILVGGIGVMNILLVSVRERRREIGIMKSLGTTQRQVCMLFLLEALMYAVIGGVAGILIGVGLIRMASASIGLNAVIRAGDCLGVLATALGVGLFFGVTPAAKAARLKPVDALRQD